MKLSNFVKGLCTAVVVSAGLWLGAVSAYAAGTGKATDDGVRIRATASKDGEVIGSSTKGNTIDIFAQTKDSEGNTWYKVTVSGDTKGYIRADYMTDVTGDIPSEGGATTTTTTTENTTTTESTTESTEATTTEVNPSAYTFGTTDGEVSVRESPSTKANKVATTATNQDVAITGEATGADGKIWYQINYGDIKGFIRSDLIIPGSQETEAPADTESAESPEGSVDEGTDVAAAPAPVSQDYELRFEPNAEGVEVWYLYDNIKGTRQTLENIFAVMNQNQQLEAKESGGIPKIVVIIMGVVIVLLVAAVLVLIFKLRDSYDGWEDDDSEEDDDDDEEEQQPVKGATSSLIPDDDEELDDDDIKIVSKKGKAKKVSTSKPAKSQGDSWKSNKFFEIDDDVEFEFLDIDK